MPRYLYKCKNCKTLTEVVHSYREKLEECSHCGDKKGLYKDLSTPITTRASMQKQTTRIGSVTKSSIEDAREEVKESKKQLLKRRKK
jgi:putative FmdB family regulatory protein